MADQQSQERLTGLMLDEFWPAASAEVLRGAVAQQLTELQRLRGNGLTEEEYTGWRTDILGSVVSNRHREPIWIGTYVFFEVLLAGLLVYGLVTGHSQATWVAGIMLPVLAVIIVQLARGLAVKRRLTIAERLGLIEEFVARGLVSADEASKLRARLGKPPASGPAEPAGAPDCGGRKRSREFW
jgi:hypothetical protein